MSPSLQAFYTDLRLPHVPLGRLPTRVHGLDALSRDLRADLWIKRDDETGRRYGGNKVRKLEFLLGHIRERGARRVLTLGAAGSHHVLATGIHARGLGIAATAVLVPQPPTAHVGRNVLAGLGAGIDLVPARTIAEGLARIAALVPRLTMHDGAPPAIVMVGGSSPLGAVGYVEAAMELASQVRAGELPLPDSIFVALGSGSTLAGLHLGFRLAGLPVEVVGVRVTEGSFSSKALVASLARGALSRLRAGSRLVPQMRIVARDVVVDSRFLGRGYGHPTEEGEEAMRIARDAEGIVLEPTYTAKTFAAFLDRARARPGRRLLYWHTLSGTDVSDLVEAGRKRGVPDLLRQYTDLTDLPGR